MPSTIASAEERVLWEMGQWEEPARADERAPLRLAAVAAPTANAARANGAPNAGPRSRSNGAGEVAAGRGADGPRASTEGTKPKPFSPVPLPRRTGTPPAQRSGSIARTPPATSPPPRRAKAPAKGGPAAAPVAEPDLKETVPAPPEAKEVAGSGETEGAKARRVARGSIVRRAGEAPPADTPEPVAEVTYRSGKREAKKRERYQRKIDKLMERMGAADGEVVMDSLDGTLGIRPATLVLTNYRIAVVPHSKRWGSRWIPLEEVNKITARPGSSMLVVDASVEVLRFGSRRAHRLHELTDRLRAEVREARTGRSSGRHNGMLVQMWCDRTSQIWDSPWGRLRLWLDHHPRLRLFMFSPLAPLGVLIWQSL